MTVHVDVDQQAWQSLNVTPGIVMKWRLACASMCVCKTMPHRHTMRGCAPAHLLRLRRVCVACSVWRDCVRAKHGECVPMLFHGSGDWRREVARVVGCTRQKKKVCRCVCTGQIVGEPTCATTTTTGDSLTNPSWTRCSPYGVVEKMGTRRIQN